MRNQRILTFFLLIALLGIAPGLSQAATNLTASEISDLAAGKLIIKPLAKSKSISIVAGASYALVDAPPDKVWQVLNKIEDWPGIFPNTFGAKRKYKKGSSSVVKMLLGNRFFKFAFHLNVAINEAKRALKFNLNKNMPADVREIRGSVRLFPQKRGRTLVSFTVYIDVPFAPVIAMMGEDEDRVLERRIFSLPTNLKKQMARESMLTQKK